MSTIPTLNYGWLIPVPGTEIDTWGPIVNTVLDQIDAEMFLKGPSGFVTPQMYGAVGDGVTDDTDAFIAACAIGQMVVVPPGDYVINNTVPVYGILYGTSTNDVIFTADCSVLNPGDLGRNCFDMQTGSQLHNCTINVTVTAFQSTPNGAYQAGVNIGIPRLGAGNVDTLKEHIVIKNVNIHGAGPLNAHGLHVYGWVERCLFENVNVSGKVNFAHVCHWSGDFDPDKNSGTATKSWHPAYLTWRNCHTTNVNTNENGFRVSAGAFILFDACTTASQDAFESYAGDLGGQLAQNIAPEDNLAGIIYQNCIKYGIGNYAFQISGNGNDGVVGRDIWLGNDYKNNASLMVRGCRAVLPASDTVLPALVASFVDKVIVDGCDFVSRPTSGTAYSMQLNCVNKVDIVNTTGVSRNGLRLRSVEEVDLFGVNIEADPASLDTSTLGISVEAHTFNAVLAANLGIGDTTVYFTTVPDTICPGSQLVYSTGKIEVDGACTNEDVPTLAWSVSNPDPYAIGSRVTNAGGKYVCILANTPSATSEPGVGATWATYWVVWPGVALHIQPSPIAITAAETVAVSNGVRKFNKMGGSVQGYRFGIKCTGVAGAPLSFVRVSGVTFERNGLYEIDLAYVDGGSIQGNFIDNGALTTSSTDTRSIHVQATSRCITVDGNIFGDNHFAKYPIYVAATGLGGISVINNKIKTCHPTTASAAAVFWGAQSVQRRPNIFAGNFIDPSILLPITPTTTDLCWKIGDKFVCQVNAIPTTGTWKAGDQAWLKAPSSGASPGSVNVTDGSFGTLAGVTGSITIGTKALVVNDATDIYPGAYITIAGVSGVKRVLKVVSTAVTIDSNASATVAGAAVAYQPPSYKAMGNLA